MACSNPIGNGLRVSGSKAQSTGFRGPRKCLAFSSATLGVASGRVLSSESGRSWVPLFYRPPLQFAYESVLTGLITAYAQPLHALDPPTIERNFDTDHNCRHA
jgi:hypothetical protein